MHSFADLAKILEPGKASKTDKANIISDAIRIVTQLRGENNQLRQLNKFLEVRRCTCCHSKGVLTGRLPGTQPSLVHAHLQDSCCCLPLSPCL